MVKGLRAPEHYPFRKDGWVCQDITGEEDVLQEPVSCRWMWLGTAWGAHAKYLLTDTIASPV